MKRRDFLGIWINLLILISLLVSCKSETAIETETPVTLLRTEETPSSETESVTELTVIERQDKEGRVTVRIENGEASITYHYDKWQELARDLDETEKYPQSLNQYEVPFRIVPYNGTVIDACIGSVEYFTEPFPEQEIPSLLVTLLMDDGGVEYLYANPVFYGEEPTIYSYGRIPYIEGVTSLSFKNDGEGIGRDTIYAIGADQLKSDLRIPLQTLFYTDIFWQTVLIEDPNGSDHLYGYLFLDENGEAEFSVGWGPEARVQVYSGTYDLIIKENDLRGKAGCIIIDLTLDWADWESQDPENPVVVPDKITGTYFLGIDPDYNFLLWLSDGEPLYNDPPSDNYTFTPYYQTEIDFRSDEELIDHLINGVFKVQQMVEQGMSVVVTGDTVYIDGVGTCRNLILGTQHEDHFVQEFYYAISQSGYIYEYNVVYDFWEFVGPAVG